jgi:hypothetical protein
MPDRPPKPARPWRLIAEEVTRETDKNKLFHLIQELLQALEEQGLGTADDRAQRPGQDPSHQSTEEQGKTKKAV